MKKYNLKLSAVELEYTYAALEMVVDNSESNDKHSKNFRKALKNITPLWLKMQSGK